MLVYDGDPFYRKPGDDPPMRERIKFHSKRLTLFFIQLAFLAGVCYIGEAVSVHLPVEVPANICSMGILLSLLISGTVSYTHLTLPTTSTWCRSRWSPYH